MLHAGPIVALHRDAVLRPDGSVGSYEHVTVHDGVRVAALDDHDQVLLVEDDFYLQHRRVLHLPGGSSEGQDPRDAAMRELEEETGVVAGHLELLGVVDPLPAITTARTHLFLATGLRLGSARRDDTEIGMTVQWWKLADAIEAVRAGGITEAGSVSALLLAGLAQLTQPGTVSPTV
ncbi:NUDIX domain-containing protein [Streptomyces inhibens]|uniref:NUDIX domain-containing protein n=1 Tax=Streptomyces inhibens TaxID=2293571 RepID=UPI0037BC58D6